jgi:hypothetical protein
MRSDEGDLENFAEHIVNNFKRNVGITPWKIRTEFGINNPRIAKDILSELYDRRILLKPGRSEIYYVNPLPPKGLSYSRK